MNRSCEVGGRTAMPLKLAKRSTRSRHPHRSAALPAPWPSQCAARTGVMQQHPRLQTQQPGIRLFSHVVDVRGLAGG